jgi:hypothetical protein
METFQRILDRFGLVHLRAAQERGGGDFGGLHLATVPDLHGGCDPGSLFSLT